MQRSRVEAMGTSMEELERINKKIDSVKTEVEEKQERISKLNLALEELTQSPIASLNDTNMREDFPEKGLLPKGNCNEPSKNKDSQPRKYMIDHKGTATDFEYDALLNYSAKPSGASKSKLDGTDQQPFCHLQKSVGENCHKTLESQRPYVSPIRIQINLEESDEDDLIIDVPPLMPTSKKSRLFRGFKHQHMDERIHITPLEERDLQISGPEEEKIDKTQQTTQIVDDSNKLEPPKLLMKTSLDTKSNVNLCPVRTHMSKMGSFGGNKKYGCINLCPVRTRMSKMESSGGNKKYGCISKEGVSCAPLSDKEILTESHNESHPKNKKHVKAIYDTQKKETECWYSPSEPQDKLVKYSVLGVPDSQDSTIFEDSKLVELDSGKGITEDDTLSDSDDTMKECLQIFNELTENEAHKEETAKQASRKQDMLYYKKNSGPKKRIAHTAKFDAPTSKEIISAFREPVPPLRSHSVILRAQQQAVQIKAAIKSGQAFVAAASEQKKNAFACPASQTQRTENSFTSSRPHLDVVLSRENPTAKTSRSHIPVKSIASFPVKMSKHKAAHGKQALVTSESSSKVPDEVRQRCISSFVQKYLKVCKTEDEALNKAKIEEKAIYEKCGSKHMYVNVAINTLKKLKNQVEYGSSNDKTTGKYEKKDVLTGIILYRHLKDYLLTEEQLRENNYPQPKPDKPGSVLLNPGMTKTLVNDASKICCRCGKIYGLTPSGQHSWVEECNYHFGQVLSHKVLSGLESRYSCCGGMLGSPGCQVAKLHVHNQKENLEGFVTTFLKAPPADGSPGVFAVNCEVCYTAKGLELTQVTVVDASLQVVYDTFVKPDEEVIDYNTRFSGVVEGDLRNTKTSIRDVQAVLLNLFSADTVLIGHNFEHSLYALKARPASQKIPQESSGRMPAESRSG
ncbi:PREDICTED: RNA exonuclease 1 homolog isoform X2 [Galeopterus variegatus]|uniref:RNA exonuclease 1 homolog isoform X2 n=1 Tax=Galeopterus variegatus TaxID=482537 RepID=A0ABM0QID8_GALVR|nr:PREDICTED: RNA exonuclease 1 homolog isoform X2 [Galeopterus variegatus]